jgi:tRNA nucleotidyltransferase (CCA-adding enzyme)
MAKTQQEGTRRAISLFFRKLKEVRPSLRGKDLAEMGVPPGPVYREILDRLLDGRLNGELTSREEEIAFVRSQYPSVVRPGPAGAGEGPLQTACECPTGVRS